MQYRPEIDGLRGVAVLLVLFFHSGLPFFSGGFVGVDVFFVISGYLITSIILHDIQNDRFSYVNFYERRIRRILPALYVMSLLVLIVLLLTQVPSDLIKSAKTLIFALLFSSNIFFWRTTDYFSGDSDFEYFLHTWSLGVEEQFYFIFPLVILLFARKQQYLLWLALAAFVVSFGISVYATYDYQWAAYYLLPSRAWQMMAGAILAITASSVVHLKVDSRWLNTLAIMAVLLVFLPAVFYSKETRFPGLAALWPTLGAVLIVFLGLIGCRGWIIRFLGGAPLRSVGLISYSLYLWHWPIFAFLRNYQADVRLSVWMSILGIAASFLMAYLSWRFVEAPFRDRALFSRRSIYSLAGVSTGIILTACVVIILLDGIPSRIDSQVIRLSQVSESEVIDNSCVSKTAGDVRAGRVCYVGENESSEDSKGSGNSVLGSTSSASIILWGDSHMSALKSSFSQGLSELGLTAAFIGRTGCPPMPQVMRVGNSGGQQCLDFNDEVMQFISRHKSIKTVVLHARWALSVEGTRYGAEQGPPYVLSDTSMSERVSNEYVVRRALERVVAQLLAMDKRVVIIASVPEVGSSVPKVVANNLFWGKTFDIRPRISDFNVRQKHTYAILSSIKSTFPNVAVVYPADVLCGLEYCRIMDGDNPLYFDDDHLSDSGAALVFRQVGGLL
jgi:peptidoglycan/LPS O-acetylase OafA/YrhL